ncbi:nucleotide exchange factor GrpE [Patescibacteria group bacterium]|nr:nucleotide exchange factor GrpE [Patescibacteria group bacterium]
MKENKDNKPLKKEEYEKKIKELEDKVESLDNSWKRALADYKNLEKRTAEEKESFLSFVKIQVLESFLPFFDNLEKLEEHSKDEGLKITLKDLQRVLNLMGVQEIEAEGKDFDPNTMEAIEMTEGEKNKVLKIHQKGYLLNGNLLRPAKVAVGQEKQEEK